MLTEMCLRPLESILSLSALVNEKEKIIKSSTLDCDHFKSRKDSELLSGKLSDHPTVVKLTEQLKDAERIVEWETLCVMNFFDRIDVHMSTMLGPETSVLVGTLQFSHNSSSHLLSQLNTFLPQSAATICELSSLFEEQKGSLTSPRLMQDNAQPVAFPAVASHVQFMNVDIFSPLQQSQSQQYDTATMVGTEEGTNEKSGILKKRNKLFWEERWFELRKPGVLTWYKNSRDTMTDTSRNSGSKEEARNHLNLRDVSSIEYTPRSCTIFIEVEGRKTYELFAAGEDLAAEWYAALVPWLKKDTDVTTTTSSTSSSSSQPASSSSSSQPPSSFVSTDSFSDTNTDTNRASDALPPPPQLPPPPPPRPLSISRTNTQTNQPTEAPPPPSSSSQKPAVPGKPPVRPAKPSRNISDSSDSGGNSTL
jgi:hypothetical protein